jgi:ABC-2 type transport system permease protein
LISLASIGAFGILISIAIAPSDEVGLIVDTDAQRAVEFINAFGLGFFVPITALILAAASLGDFRDDGSLVYLWLRPVSRSMIIAAAMSASLTVVLPLAAIPLIASATIMSGESEVVVATWASVAIGVVAYVAIFVALGLRTTRALLWGLVYVLLWEGFISRAGGAGRLSISNYTRSILTHVSGTDLDLAEASLATAYIVPVVVAIGAAAYAVRRFQHQEVE